MQIHRAQHLGMCFGVRDAIALALETGRQRPLTIVGELVHNETVLDRLRAEGIGLAAVAAPVSTATAMITAHGASESRIESLRRRGHQVLEATCPLVHAAHRAVLDLVRAGFHPVIVGRRDHVEVRGLVEDLDAYDVVLTAEDVARLPERPRYGVAAQTTQPLARVWQLADLLRCRYPESEVHVVDTVCRPTKLRQWAAEDLARRCPVVVVVGGRQSNNTRELAETCRRSGARVYQVQTAADLCAEWFGGVRDVGLTAGTSTPDEVVDGVERALVAMAERLAIMSHSMGRLESGVAERGQRSSPD